MKPTYRAADVTPLAMIWMSDIEFIVYFESFVIS